MVELKIGFRTISCLRCGATRQTTISCPDCGAKPAETEIDIHVQRRNAATADAAQRRAEDVSPSEQSAIQVLGDPGFASLLDDMLTAAENVALAREDGSGQLADAAARLGALEAWAAGAVSLRPSRSLDSETRRTIRALGGTFDALISALNAERMDVAQAKARDLQEAIDHGADALHRASELLDRQTSLLASDDPMATWMQLAVDGDPPTGASRGQSILKSRTGEPHGPAAGFAALVYDLVADTVGDSDQFWSSFRSHDALLSSHLAEIADLTAEGDFASRVQEVVHDAWSAARRAAVMPDPLTLRQSAHDLLEAGHLLVEQVWKFHLGIACACTTRMTFEATQAKDVSELVHVAIDQGWGLPVSLRLATVRNAFAHRDFVIDGDRVRLSARRSVTQGREAVELTLPELLDQVLEMVEGAAACDLALAAAAEEAGVEDRLVPTGAYLAETLLKGLGWQDVAVDATTEPATVSATVQGPIPIGAIAMAVQPLVRDASHLRGELTRSDTGVTSKFLLDVTSYAAWSALDQGLSKDQACVRAFCATTVNDLPLMSRDQASKVIALSAVETAADQSRTLSEVRRDLASWRQVAADVGLAAIANLVGRAIKWRLLAASEISVDAKEMDELLEVAGREVPELIEALA